MKTDCSAAYGLSEMSVGEVEASRIASSDTGHYILIRAKDLASSSQDASSSDQERPTLESAGGVVGGGGFIVEDEIVGGGGFIVEDDQCVAPVLPTVVDSESRYVESSSSGGVSPRLLPSEMREHLEAEDNQPKPLESIEAEIHSDQETICTSKDLLSASTGVGIEEINEVSPIIIADEDSASEMEDEEQEKESSLKLAPITIHSSPAAAATPTTSSSVLPVADVVEEDGMTIIIISAYLMTGNVLLYRSYNAGGCGGTTAALPAAG